MRYTDAEKIVNLQANKQNVDKVSDEGEFGAVVSAENSPKPGTFSNALETSIEINMSKKEEQMKQELMHLAGQFLRARAGHQSLITVTRSEMSSDMKYITLFISVFPTTAEKKALDFCKRERSAFRQFVIQKSALHFPPTIDFEIDIGEKNRQRIDELTRE